MGTVMYDPKEDARFVHPYIDVDEMRERKTADKTIPYRYMHGGFAGTSVKFSFFFPEKEAYEGRFWQYLSPFPGPDEEVASIGRTGVNDRIAFSLVNGGYFVETNMGSSSMFGAKEDDQLVWKSSAAAAEFSREKAMEIYGCGRPYGYVYGGSGGGYKTMACIENTRAWDGALPYVIGSPASLPNTITMHAQGQRTLRNAFGKIVDALDAGGSGDPYAELDGDERFFLKELTRMGFPPMAWYLEAWGEIDDGSLPVLAPGVKRKDPDYFKDFWEKDGYLGADQTSSAVRDRLQFESTVVSVKLPGEQKERSAENGLNGVDDAWKKMMADGSGAWIELEELPQGDDLYLSGVHITPLTGDAAGMQLLLDGMVRKEGAKGGCLTIGMCYGMSDLSEALGKIKPGDKVRLDNSDYIAIQSYYRHQVPEDASFTAWDQFRDADGKPALPQRENVMGYGFTGTGTVQDGNIQGKVIQLQALMDESTCPWCADWYRKQVRKSKGSEDDYRVYFMERCMHGDTDARSNYMVVNYMGALRRGLLDLAAWVERGIEPPASTAYELVDGQIAAEPDIRKRQGIQAVVSLLADGQACAHVKAGEEVRFHIDVKAPLGAGAVTAVEMCFETDTVLVREEGADLYPAKLLYETYCDGELYGARAQAAYTYDRPGTYFAAVHVTTQRDGDKAEPYTQVRNMNRVRIVVE